MSPRAAWRLEAFGYTEVYDYAVGKSDWLAAGLPTDGGRPRPPRVADTMDPDPPTCRPDEPVTVVAARMAGSRAPVCVVVNDRRVVHGRLRGDRIDPVDGRTAEQVMEPGPATVRADADLAETVARMSRRKAQTLIVSNPDGVLLGVLLGGQPTEPSQ